jgi:class 3 adenylate cyclase
MNDLVNLITSFGAVGTALAIAAVPVISGAAVYVTRMGSQAKIDSLESAVNKLKQSSDDEKARAQQKYEELFERYTEMLRSGALIETQLNKIRSEIADVAARLDASDYSVLVPAASADLGATPDHLVFLCASGPQWTKLKYISVPISTSLSGDVFSTGTATIAAPTSPTAFANRTDKIVDYKTNQTLSVCLKYRNQSIGVAQFLNKRSGLFNSADAELAQALCAPLAIRVADFVSDPKAMIELGYAPQKDKLHITAMFVDLSNFAHLFNTIDAGIITRLLNEYFQEICTIALSHSAVVDQYIGDGIFFVFGLGQRPQQHLSGALKASAEMRDAFESLKRRWVTLGYNGTEALFIRLGLSCGVVSRAEIGHMQFRRLTVIGSAVNIASHVCQAAPRDRNTICFSREMLDALDDRQRLKMVPISTSLATIFELP